MWHTARFVVKNDTANDIYCIFNEFRLCAQNIDTTLGSTMKQNWEAYVMNVIVQIEGESSL